MSYLNTPAFIKFLKTASASINDSYSEEYTAREAVKNMIISNDETSVLTLVIKESIASLDSYYYNIYIADELLTEVKELEIDYLQEVKAFNSLLDLKGYDKNTCLKTLNEEWKTLNDVIGMCAIKSSGTFGRVSHEADIALEDVIDSIESFKECSKSIKDLELKTLHAAAMLETALETL